MITKRIIPCLDIRNGRVVKGTNFEGLADVNDPVGLARFYSENGADALIALCRRVKALTGGRKLVGTYYGYTMTFNRTGNSVLRGGHEPRAFHRGDPGRPGP